ncbi:unnamed protein product [Auanema sp. JU1783]|nr:unnamed protein product [Auanema sp. JU1783]
MIETCLNLGFNMPFPSTTNVMEPEAKRVRFNAAQDSDSSSSEQSPKHDTSLNKSLNSSTNEGYERPGHPEIVFDGKFSSFAEFEEVFHKWKVAGSHPFRVASSETLKEPNGNINNVHKYRYVVYHCAHYGNPRVRGTGKRPCKTYLACGCQAVLRLNYKFSEKALRITTLNIEHNHPTNPEHFAISQKTGRSPATKARRMSIVKTEVPASPLSQSSISPSPSSTVSETAQSSPTSTVSNTTNSCNSTTSATGVQPTAALPPLTAALLYQQQLINVLLAQQNLQKQKENLERLSFGQRNDDGKAVGFPNMFDVFSPQMAMPSPVMNMSPFMNQTNVINNENYTKHEDTSEEVDVVSDMKPIPGLITPKAVRPAVNQFAYTAGQEPMVQLKSALDKVFELSSNTSGENLKTMIPLLQALRDQWRNPHV